MAVNTQNFILCIAANVCMLFWYKQACMVEGILLRVVHVTMVDNKPSYSVT